MSRTRPIFGNLPEDVREELKGEAHENVKGYIYYLNEEEGWGFIEATSEPELRFIRIYFHWQWLQPDTLNFKQLERGMQVEFEARENRDKGWRAIKVRVLKEKE